MFIVNCHNVVPDPLDAYDRGIAPRLDIPQFIPKELPFAYPYGGPQHIGARAHELVASSGFSCALTTTPGRNTPATDRHRLGRINVEDLHSEHRGGVLGDVLGGGIEYLHPGDRVHDQSSLFSA